ncbi:helix-turn-helix domain-containing protein [Streptomyces sp. NPDC004111]|uniref:helix-turn-helix domain-containing protein n=1 Tax=Streptomyces sp. NPDC004111 TaxID=3364690 RepID=UPI0036C6CFFE
MARWKALPAELGERDRQLVVQLRRMKDHSGLSLVALETKTASSRSSWERYLNGRTPPPREAVADLARVCGADPTRLLVLYDVAARERDGQRERDLPGTAAAAADGREEPAAAAPADGTGAPAGADGPGPPTARTLHLGPPLVGVAVFALLVALAAGYALARVLGDEGAPADGAARGYAYEEGRTFPCEVGRKDGGLYAGHSVSRDALLMTNSKGWDVVEAQCLLRYHHLDPGAVDGLYGARARGAVEIFQREHRLVVDGVVGEHTWQELRR